MISWVQVNTNFEGDEVDLIDENGGDDGVDGEFDGDATPQAK
jgi:hypothetical protein